MKYYSLNNKQHKVTFQQALLNSLAPDNGLYFPETITALPSSFFATIEQLNPEKIAFEVIRQFIGNEIPKANLKQIIKETLCFEFPIIQIAENSYSLELYHGPTMAFKDVGARFMSRCLAYFNQQSDKKTTILVATSGDTGGAVANGFLGAENTNVMILYPSGKVSDFQELQLTTLGKNITALEVNGTFDDCQAMVKKAFSDPNLKTKNLTSANSINIARWLPQLFYFFFAYRELKKHGKSIILSCPSGNFGNLCAGILAKKLGLPIAHFVAATNANDTVPRFLAYGDYQPNETIATLSNAMDVSNPSNFIRIQELYNHDLNTFQKDFSAYSFTDEETKSAMQFLHENHQYIAEPHGAIGYLGLQEELKKQPDAIGVFLETAHPIKFAEIVETTLQVNLSIPEQFKSLSDKEKTSIKIATYQQLKDYLLS
ncbi:threonine synthase [Flavobacterium enshiense]|uniref:threonine synthase n=1 Tax=Flavobacterium enshiense TaxID=1341165 RepID=UPI00345D4EFA